MAGNRPVPEMRDILTFERMIAPAVLQVLFWAAIGGNLYGTYVLVALGSWAWPFPLVLGTLVVRVLFEVALLLFRIYDRMGVIEGRPSGIADRGVLDGRT